MSGWNTSWFARQARRLAIVSIAVVGFGAGADLARAEGQCDFLSFSRNKIYKAAGYCFKTAAQIRNFGNAGCSYDNQEDVPLSANQRREVAAIIREERQLGWRGHGDGSRRSAMSLPALVEPQDATGCSGAVLGRVGAADD